MKTDALLINAPVEAPLKNRHARLSPPLGLGYIGAVLMENDYNVSAIDLNIRGLNKKRVQNVIERESPEILGISTYTETYLNGLKVASIAKEIDPEINVVMGGPHPSVTYESTAAIEDVDFVCRGEGERTMLELADSLLGNGGEVKSIEGLAYEKNGEVKTTPSRGLISDADELPFPARELFPLYLYEHPANVLTSRGGCPFECRFCAVNNIWEGGRVFRDPDTIMDEIVHIFKNFRFQQINFADDTFTLKREHTIEVVNRLADLNPPFPWVWTCSTRADLVDRELLEAMADSGCTNIQYGVEAGTQETLDLIGKGISLNQIRDAVKMAQDVGIDVLCSFMYPHPDDTEETIRKQIEFMKEIDEMGAGIVLSFTAPFPGTYYAENMDELGIEVHADNWAEYDCESIIISTEHLSLEELRELFRDLYHEVGLESVQQELLSKI